LCKLCLQGFPLCRPVTRQAKECADRKVPVYVAAQLGHARPTTTLQFYAHWIPSGAERFVDGLAGPTAKKPRSRKAGPQIRKATVQADSRGHQLGTKSVSGAPGTLEAPEKFGGPWRTRTSDPLIKSQLLYQLS
jgi:hypothetical protein